VHFHGHLVALVVGETEAQCRAAAAKVVVEYETLPSILTTREAIERDSFHTGKTRHPARGRETRARAAPMSFRGEFECGGQEHFYLESHAARAMPGRTAR
jgi:xanthine dehydrogenase molybdopterin-binding subunit B